MTGASNAAQIAIWISVGAGLATSLLAIPTGARTRTAIGAHKVRITERIMLAAAIALTALIATAAMLVSVRGVTFLWFAKATLLLTAAFALVGMVIGAVRGLRSGSGVGPGIG